MVEPNGLAYVGVVYFDILKACYCLVLEPIDRCTLEVVKSIDVVDESEEFNYYISDIGTLDLVRQGSHYAEFVCAQICLDTESFGDYQSSFTVPIWYVDYCREFFSIHCN